MDIEHEMNEQAFNRLIEVTAAAEYEIIIYMRDELNRDFYTEEEKIMCLEGCTKIPELSTEKIETYFDPADRAYIEVKKI